MSDIAIRAHAVDKTFGPVVALAGFDLEVATGEIVTILGPSGCGKTTALRVIAGFERPDRGSVEVAGNLVAGESVFVAPERRRVGMVFQDYALFPHMTVRENVAYGLAPPDREARVRDTLDMVGLVGSEGRHPHELSGGQQQRVALARALAPRPEVILLDEPFSNLDASLRQRVRREVKQILTEAKATALFVTHDQEEALSLSDRVAVMQAGRVRQVSAPPDLYRSPADPWVADFLGDADFVNGLAANGKAATPVGEFATELSGSVTVMLRPENVRISPDPAGPGQVSGVEYFGHDQLITAVLDLGVIIRTRSGPGAHFQVGDRVRIEVAEATVFPA